MPSNFNKTKVNISSTRQALQELSANGYKLTGGSRSEWDMELLKPLQNIDEGKTFSSSTTRFNENPCARLTTTLRTPANAFRL